MEDFMATTPTTSNHCIGSNDDGTTNINLYCYKGVDDEGDPIYVCATWRRFKVSCPKVNSMCSSLSEAWLPAITVCNQRLM
jgi:hypothetical protein